MSSIERIAYRPLRNAPKLAPLISAIGMSFVLQNIGLPDRGPGQQERRQLFPTRTSCRSSGSRRSRSRASRSFVAVVTIPLLIALTWFVEEDPAGPGDARDRAGSGHGRPDGRQRRPDDRAHVPHRWRAGRRGGRRPDPLQQRDGLEPRLPVRAERVHVGRPGRDRQPLGRGRSARSSSADQRLQRPVPLGRTGRTRSCSGS